MRTFLLMLLCLLVLFSGCMIIPWGGVPSSVTYVASENERLYGIWINPEYTTFLQKPWRALQLIQQVQR